MLSANRSASWSTSWRAVTSTGRNKDNPKGMSIRDMPNMSGRHVRSVEEHAQHAVRSLYVSTHAAVTSSGFPLLCGNDASAKLLYDNLQLLLVNTVTASRTAKPASSIEPNIYVPERASHALITNSMPLHQAPILMPGKNPRVSPFQS
jgi:hypothetical protein